MDLRAEFDRIIAEMDDEEVLQSTLSLLNEVLGGVPSVAPPPPPAVPAEEGFSAFPQPADPLGGGYGAGAPPGAWLHRLEQPLMAHPAPGLYQGPLCHHGVMQSGLLYGQAAAHTQGQHQPYDWPVHIVPAPVVAIAPPQPYHSFPQAMLPRGTNLNLAPVGTLTGSVALAPAAKPLNTTNSKKRKRVSRPDDDQPYVKKPPNAFMLFRKEQRPNVVAELNVSECAAVNTVLGQRWKSLSSEERAKYYEEAHEEKLRHAEQFPEWSAKNNYGKKRKRVRSKAPPSAGASASNPEELTQEAKRLRVSPVEAAAVAPSALLIDTTEASHTPTGVMEAPGSLLDIVEASHTPTGVMEAPGSLLDIVEASHTPTGVMDAPGSWLDIGEASHTSTGVMDALVSWLDIVEASHTPTGVMEAPHTLNDIVEASHTPTGVMEAPYTLMDIMEAFHTPAGVMEAPYTWTDTMEAPHTPTGVMEAPIAHKEVTEPSLWDLPTASAAKCEETTQPAEEMPPPPPPAAAKQPSASQTAATGGGAHTHAGTTEAPESEHANDFLALLQMCRMDLPAASGPEPEQPPTTHTHTGTMEAEPVSDVLGLLKLCEMFSADSTAQCP